MKHTPAAKPVAETWFSVEAYDGDILRFREHDIDAYASGDFWLVRGDDEALVVDTGCGIVSPAGLVWTNYENIGATRLMRWCPLQVSTRTTCTTDISGRPIGLPKNDADSSQTLTCGADTDSGNDGGGGGAPIRGEHEPGVQLAS